MTVTPGYCATMARYNLWQNRSLIAAASTLDDAARRADRGLFFASIAGTLSHLLWADGVWMARFTDTAPPAGGIKESPALYEDWQGYKVERATMDARILDWADGLHPEDLEGELEWYSGALGRDMVQPRALCITHFFNHQTHHRGQIHGALTAEGLIWGDTDLVFMPGDIGI